MTQRGAGRSRAEEGERRAARPVAGRGAARHGYEIGKLIETRSQRRAALQHRLALSAALPPGEARLDQRAVGREGRPTPAPLLPAHARRTQGARRPAERLAELRRGDRTGSRASSMPDEPRTRTRDGTGARDRPPAGRARRRRRPAATEIVDEIAQHLDRRRAGSDGAIDSKPRLKLAELESPPGPRAGPHRARAPTLEPPVLGRARSPSWQHCGRTSTTRRDRCGSDPGYGASSSRTLALASAPTPRFSAVADAAMLRPFPYPDRWSGSSRSHETTRAGQQMSIAWPTFQDWLAQNQSFEHLGLYRGAAVNLTAGEPAGTAQRRDCLVGVFRRDGHSARSLGRTLRGRGRQPGGARVAVISERLWRARFERGPGDPGTGDRPERRCRTWSSASCRPACGSRRA